MNKIIYDYFKDGGYFTLYVCLGLIILLVSFAIYMIISLFLGNKSWFEILLRISAVGVSALLIGVSLLPGMIVNYKMKKEYDANLSLLLVGEMKEVELENYGSRYEPCDITFGVDDTLFRSAIKTDDYATIEKIKQSEGKTIKVWYTLNYDIYKNGKHVYKVELVD